MISICNNWFYCIFSKSSIYTINCVNFFLLWHTETFCQRIYPTFFLSNEFEGPEFIPWAVKSNITHRAETVLCNYNQYASYFFMKNLFLTSWENEIMQNSMCANMWTSCSYSTRWLLKTFALAFSRRIPAPLIHH